MYQQQRPLPVNPTQPMQQPIGGLPSNHGIQLNVNVSVNMQPYLTYIVGIVIGELETQAHRNPLRMTLYNLCAMNRWQNDDFAGLVLAVAEYAEFKLATGQQTQPEQQIYTATQELCAIFSATNVPRYPELASMLDQQSQNEVNRLIQLGNQLIAQIDQWSGQGQYQQPAPQQQWGQQQSQYQQQQAWGSQSPQGHQQTQWGGQSQPQQWGRQQQSNPGQFAMANEPQRANTWSAGSYARGQNQHAPQQPQQNQRQYGGIGKARVHNAEPEENLNEEVTFTGGHVERTVHGRTIMPKAAFETRKSSRSFPTPHVVEEVKAAIPNPEEPEVRYAATSGWKRTFTLERPYGMVYNPNTHVMLHVRYPDGTVLESLEEITEGMEYTNHELKPTFPKKGNYERAENRPAPRWKEIAEMKTMTEILAEQDTFPGEAAETIVSIDPIRMDNVNLAHSNYEAELLARCAMMKVGIELNEETGLEYRFRSITPVYTEDNVIGVIKALATQDSLKSLADKFSTVYRQLGDRLWTLINDRLTARFNEVLQCNLQLEGWRVDSFADDYLDMSSAILKQYGDGLLLALERQSGKIIQGVLDVLKGTDFGLYLEQLATATGQEKEVLNKHTLVLSELTSVTHVPWCAHDMEIQMDGSAGAVLETRTPALLEVIQGIVKRAKQSGEACQMYIKTHDNVTLKIYEGYIGKDFYLIGKV